MKIYLKHNDIYINDKIIASFKNKKHQFEFLKIIMQKNPHGETYEIIKQDNRDEYTDYYLKTKTGRLQTDNCKYCKKVETEAFYNDEELGGKVFVKSPRIGYRYCSKRSKQISLHGCYIEDCEYYKE